MIVYIASYPRSGNSWIQRIIYSQFRRLSSSVYPIKNYPPANINDWNVRIQAKAPKPWSIRILLNPKLWKKDLIWNESIAFYNDPERRLIYRFIMPGCLEFLTEENRKRLSEEKEIFFVKTHELPYRKYFEGERVIQPIRNPGASIWSYYNLIEATKQPKEKQTSLTEVIKGNVRFGSWSDYHERWLNVASELGNRYLKIYFEWLKDDQDEACKKIKVITGLKYLKRKFETFEELQKLNPIAKREGKAFGWEKNFSNEQLRLLYDCHGEMMKKLNYPEPIYRLENLENNQGSRG